MIPSLDAIRQAAAVILAYTIRDIVPDVLMVKGERTDIGFYYDFILKQPLDKEALPIIEERMRINIKKGLKLKSLEMMRENASSLFNYHRQPIQSNLVLYSDNNVIPIVQIDSFYDFSHPPYTPVSSDIAAFKILSITKEKINVPGSGDLDVTRITGTAFHDKESLKKFVKKLEEAKKLDYRKLGEQRNLFLLEKSPIWLPKGTQIREKMTDWWKKEHQKQGYSFVKASSHYDIFRHFNPSNADLPVRYAEMSEEMLPKEQSVDHSLLKCQIYTHDIATTFCTKEQVQDEINKSLQFIQKTSNILGIGNQWYLVTQNNRDKAIEPLVEGLKQCGITYSTEMIKKSGNRGAKIEVKWVDFLGREWLGPTLTLENHGDIAVITRSVFGSLERCIALLVELHGLQKENIAESFEQQ